MLQASAGVFSLIIQLSNKSICGFWSWLRETNGGAVGVGAGAQAHCTAQLEARHQTCAQDTVRMLMVLQAQVKPHAAMIAAEDRSQLQQLVADQ